MNGKKKKQRKTGWKKDGLKGKVRECRIYNMEEESGKFVKGNLYRTMKYDAQGNIMEDCHYKADGKQDYKIVWKYDGKGNETECCYFNNKGDLYGKDYWIYDAKGNNIEYYEGLRVRFEVTRSKRKIKSKAGLFHNNSALNVKITFITLYV